MDGSLYLWNGGENTKGNLKNKKKKGSGTEGERLEPHPGLDVLDLQRLGPQALGGGTADMRTRQSKDKTTDSRFVLRKLIILELFRKYAKSTNHVPRSDGD